MVYLSVSDQFHVKVGECTTENVGWIGAIEREKVTGKERNYRSEFVKNMKRLGAIPIARLIILLHPWSWIMFTWNVRLIPCRLFGYAASVPHVRVIHPANLGYFHEKGVLRPATTYSGTATTLMIKWRPLGIHLEVRKMMKPTNRADQIMQNVVGLFGDLFTMFRARLQSTDISGAAGSWPRFDPDIVAPERHF